MRCIGLDPGAVVGMCLLEVRGATAWWLGDDATRDPFGSPLLEDPVDMVVIESVLAVFPRDRFGAGMATAIANASEIAGQLRRHYEAQRIPVRRVAAATWRKAVVGKGNAGDAQVRATIELVVKDWPRRSSVHVRDAAGCALWGARTVELERRAATQAGAAR